MDFHVQLICLFLQVIFGCLGLLEDTPGIGKQFSSVGGKCDASALRLEQRYFQLGLQLLYGDTQAGLRNI